MPHNVATKKAIGGSDTTSVRPTSTPSMKARIVSAPGRPERTRTIAPSSPDTRTLSGRTDGPEDEKLTKALSRRLIPRGSVTLISVVASPKP